jgi:hypothetical protein
MPTAGAPRSLSEMKVPSTGRGENPANALTYVFCDHVVDEADDES